MKSVAEHLQDLSVAIHKGDPGYLETPPFDASEAYPEYDKRLAVSGSVNPAYSGVRGALRQLGLDHHRYGTPEWNPLGSAIAPGHTVVIKPNFVLSDHYRGGNLFSIITHPSVLRVVIDYVYRALAGDGRIIIADTPQMDCDFEELLERTGLRSIQDLYRTRMEFEVEVRDLREFWFKYKDENYLASQENRFKLPGDPEGSVMVDLGGRSAFRTRESDDLYGADFNRDETVSHHSGGRHEYMMSRTILGADVLISVPKLKVHKKVGVTLNSKGFVGTVTNKNYLVHYTLGAPEKGGDQFPPGFLKGRAGFLVRTQRYLYDRLLARKDRFGNRIFQGIYRPYRKFIKPMLKQTTDAINLYDGGNWYGNDSAWRMVSDLVKILYYADGNGLIQDAPQRKMISIVDGITGGEGNGPLFPDERNEGLILAGFNPLAVDLAGTRLMGFDWRKLRWAVDLVENEDFDFFLHDDQDLSILTNDMTLDDLFSASGPSLGFKPHPGWVGHIERAPEQAS